MSLSTPIQQIRNLGNQGGNVGGSVGGGNVGGGMGGGMPGLPSMSTQQVNQNLQMPVYNPNPESIQQSPQQQLQNPMSQNPLQQPSTQNNSQLVDDILREMSSDDIQQGPEPDLNVGNINYAMDNVNIPPEPQVSGEGQLQPENTTVSSVESILNNGVDSSDIFSDLKLDEPIDETAVDKFVKGAKPVILVFVIVVILSLHQVNRVIFSFVPQLIIENGQLSIYGILFRGLLAAILYFAGTYLL